MFGFSSFSESPFSALPLNSYSLSANAGSYSITGGEASFTLNQAINGQAGSYVLTGSSATFIYNQVIYAGAWNFQVTGQNAGLLRGRLLTAEAGSYALTGNNAQLETVIALNADAGSYVFTGQNANLEYTPIPVIVTETKGGIGKKRKTKEEQEKEQREELEAIVKREFDILDGTYVPEVVEQVKESVIPKLKLIDPNQYNLAIAQVNALLLQAKIQAAEYESELDDEESLLMLL